MSACTVRGGVAEKREWPGMEGVAKYGSLAHSSRRCSTEPEGSGRL